MIIDFARPTTPAEMDVDLCIVGAGPAGITLARSFAGSAMTVCLLESGGLDGEPDSQALCRGVSTGLALDPAACRVRTFGGAGNAWGGGCIPLDPADLTQRDWVPHSGWPLSFDALAPYYERALDHCGIGQHRLAPGTFATPPARTPPGFDPDQLVNRTFILSPVFFGEVGREALGQAPNITVLLHANALELETDDTARTVRAARIGTLDGRRGRVHARTWVLACGGIENARLLLLSDAVAPSGLGNDRDLVGRYFMDHPSGSLGRIDGGVPDPLCRPYDRSGGQGATQPFGAVGVHEHQVLLEKDRAVQARRQHEMPLAQGAGVGVAVHRDGVDAEVGGEGRIVAQVRIEPGLEQIVERRVALGRAAHEESQSYRWSCILDRVIATHPDHAEARYLLGRIALREGRREEAARELLRYFPLRLRYGGCGGQRTCDLGREQHRVLAGRHLARRQARHRAFGRLSAHGRG